jgi:hypothetical protein
MTGNNSKQKSVITALFTSAQAEKNCFVSLAQAEFWAQKMNKNKNELADHYMQYSQLPAYLLLMQKADPKGYYYLRSGDLKDYYNVDRDNKRFTGYMLVPSASIEMWKTSSRIATVDAAHMKTHYKGTMIIAAMRDFNGFVHILSISVHEGNETCFAWEYFLESCLSLLERLGLSCVVLVSCKNKIYIHI